MQLSIAQQRLLHQGIANSPGQQPVDVVHWLGAIQAQDYASAEWTIGVRLPSTSPTAISQAFAQRAIVRTWLLRGTLHVVSAADVRWLLSLLAPTLLARFAPFYHKLELDAASVSKGYEAITQSLASGTQLTRAELLVAMAERGAHFEGLRAANLLNRAALDGLICLGTMQGKQQTFVLLDEWLPPTNVQPMPRDEALAQLALRYFTSHGPTTIPDFAWWAGITMGDARMGLEAIKSHLTEETINGKSYWRSPTLSDAQTFPPTTCLLPGFDEFVLGYADRSHFLATEHAPKIAGSNAVFAYTMLLDGQIVGTWKRTIRKKHIEITFLPFAPMPSTQIKEFAITAQAYGEFYGLPIQLGELG